MPKVVISDTSVLILFHKIGELNLLQKIYGELITTPEVAEEFGGDLPDWIEVKSASDSKYQTFLETQIDRGEASAIALATDYEDILLLLDDLKARKLAIKMNFKISGTLGVIYKAKQLGMIDKVKPMIDKISNTNFRIADNIVNEILRLNNE
jgi:predicted nucleic acid-binding protein